MTGVLPYFPKVSFIINALEKREILVCPQLSYNKKWHVNRAVIPGSNGLISLTIPIQGGRNSKSKQDEVKIDNRYHWQRDHFRTLESVYGRSPFFSYYTNELESLFQIHTENLLEWNMACIQWILRRLKSEEELSIRTVSIENVQSFKDHSIGQESQPGTMRYPQVFEERTGFKPDMSIVDLVFNMGPDAFQKIVSIQGKPNC
jgi:hypothetical protein